MAIDIGGVPRRIGLALLARFPEVMFPQTTSFCVAPGHHQALMGRSVSGGTSQSLGEESHSLRGHT